jgi:hypothetical protein
MVITKNRTGSANDWGVYHKNANASPANGAVFLNLTNAFTSNIAYFNNTAPTSTVFSMGSGYATGSKNYLAYVFSEVAGYSKFGSYTGNGLTDGPFVFCGFRPRYVLIKRSDVGANWWVIDVARSVNNQMADVLLADLPGAEFATGTGWPGIDIVSNGFKVRSTAGGVNTSGGTYIYAAFAEHPFGGENVSPATAR